jgi:hypothetical protein
MTSREEIVQEIQRTAEENGGEPLRRRRFHEVTGISPYDWGAYWPRFTEAQREAGFEPNKLNAALEVEFVMEKYIGLIRRLEKLPTAAEMRIERKRDPAFPSSGVIGRAGRTNERLEKVLAYCRTRPEYADVMALCEAAVQRSAPGTRSAEKRDDAQGTSGFVYLAKGHRGEYKIGRTNLVDRRVSELGAMASVELERVHEIKTDDPTGVEAYWHRRFENRRMRGEWFKLTAADVKAFKRWRRIF